ncbi:PRD domain-containing protein [Fonticella tunisiensis]|uniref:BglG family transcriptional antiterminator n=1 Tax=Fonticella tunisiensis TaxID=1096341 RepID=A0A4V3ETK7_9CLOT|nr:PRD domain-containing protein [Fonticella tunisiensis]TDT56517.1 BglG family transcriptional antiterminator [Fonticella tunisiensis]
MTGKYIINKVLSNNVVISEKEDKLYVLLGKGIGFGRKKGDIIDDEKLIEKKFAAIEGEDREDYRRILKDIDKDIIAVSEEIIALAINRFGERLNSHIHVALADHLNFSINRLKEGIDIVNPFLFEIKAMYPDEYSIAQSAVELINKRLNIKLPESEIGFIALHIHSARVNQRVTDSLKYTELVKEVIDFIQKETGVSLNQKSFDYARLISHLKYSLYRIESGKTLKNILLSSVKRRLRDEYKLATKVCCYISEKLHKEVSEDEIGYIALHLNRLKNNA